MIIIAYTKDFQKSLKKKDKFIQEKTRARIRLFRQDPFNVLLDNHKLHGEYEGYSSINITGDFRAIFKYITEGQVVFYDIGTHPELYG
jgi:addiction module RelE/StbE family toxin